MSPAQTIADVETLLQRGDLVRAGELIRSMRWGSPQWSPPLRLQALLWLLEGKRDAAMAEISRLALTNDPENRIWHDVACFYSGQQAEAFTASEFLGQVAVKRLRHSPYIDFPAEVHIETLTACNAKCSFCPYPKLERLGNRMSDDLIDKIIGDLESIPRDLPFALSPFKVNDPLIDKRIFNICTEINHRLPSARLRLFTNGSPLTDSVIERIARIEHLEHLWISLNEYLPDTYFSVMGIPLERTLKRLDRLHQAVESGFPHPIIISRVRDRTTNDESFVNFIRQRYPRFAITVMPYANWAQQVPSMESLPVPANGCVRWFELSIMSTGKVALCCMDGEGRHVIGDISTQTVLDIYNSPDYRRLRESVESRKNADFPCNRCAI
jgi:hypothetical protein